MTAPRPVTALGAPPAWSAGEPASEPGFGCVWEVGGAVAVAWPAGAAELAPFAIGHSGGRQLLRRAPRGKLVAAFLTAEDCAVVAAAWDYAYDQYGGSGFRRACENGRASRLRAAQRLAAPRARERAALLRALRRREQPPGSACVAHFGTTSPLVRWPDGRGWWGDAAAPCEPWGWSRGSRGVAMRVLALGLTVEDCEDLAGEDTVEGAERVLRERGLA